MSVRALVLDSVLKRAGAREESRSVADEIERRRREGAPRPAPVPARLSSRFVVTDTLVQGSKVVRLGNRSRTLPRAVVFLPGGAYAHPISSFHWTAIARLARAAGIDAIVPLYEIVPEGDASRAHRLVSEVLSTAVDEYGPHNVVLAGDSAGAGLALSVLQRDPHSVAAAVLISPWLDVDLAHPAAAVLEEWDAILHVDELRQWGAAWAGQLSTADPMVSPLRGRFEALPPVHVVTGGRDLLMSDALDVYRLLRRAGNSAALTYAPDGNHAVGLTGTATPEARRAQHAIVAALKSPISTPRTRA